MEEIANGPQELSSEPGKKKNLRKIVKRSLLAAGMVLAAYPHRPGYAESI